MNKKIITIAEIVFALVFVILLAVFMATINSKGNQANTQLVDTLDVTGNTSIGTYQQYEDSQQPVKGTVVVNACNNYRMIGNDIKLQITVITGKDNKKIYGYATKDVNKEDSGCNAAKMAGEEIGGYTAPLSTDPYYINPSGNFTVSMETNANDVYTGIVFTQEVKTK